MEKLNLNDDETFSLLIKNVLPVTRNKFMLFIYYVIKNLLKCN